MAVLSMGRSLLQAVLAGLIAITPSLSLAQPHSVAAEPAAMATPADVAANLSPDDRMAVYFSALDQENPMLAEFALGGLTGDRAHDEAVAWHMPRLPDNDPLLDADPFFMQSQLWKPKTGATCQGNDNSDVCVVVQAQELTLQVQGQASEWHLHAPLIPRLETEDYLILSAADPSIFQAKEPGSAEHSEGVFFIAKKDLRAAAVERVALPVMYMPLPGQGWTGLDRGAFDFDPVGQIVLYNEQQDMPLPLDVEDFQTVEKISRLNLHLAQSWTILESGMHGPMAAGFGQFVLPKTHSTYGFGLFLSGHMAEVQGAYAAAAAAESPRPLWQRAMAQVLPTAHADERDARLEIEAAATPEPEEAQPSLLRRLARRARAVVAGIREYRRPILAYGIKSAVVGAMFMSVKDKIDWHHLIAGDINTRVAIVTGMLGACLITSVILKSTVRAEEFRNKYNMNKSDPWRKRFKDHLKSTGDELAHMLYTTSQIIPQTIRHTLDLLKDRMFPRNKTLNTVWEYTIGYMIKVNQKLAMNWKTFLLGALVFGMADAFMVMQDILVVGPWVNHAFNLSTSGAMTAAYATSVVIFNFLGYLQQGAHSYSSDVKMIEQVSAEMEARSQMTREGYNPDDARNRTAFEERVEKLIEQRFKSRGLPDSSEFLYDPNSILEDVVGATGYSTGDALKPKVETKQLARQLLQRSDLNSRQRLLLKQLTQVAGVNAQELDVLKSLNLEGAQLAVLADTGRLSQQSNQLLKSSRFVLESRRWGLAIPALKAALKTARRLQSDGGTSEIGEGVVRVLSWALKRPGVRLAFSSEARDVRMVMFLMSTNGDVDKMMEFLPGSWTRRAGSREAAVTAARMFHRAFFAYYSIHGQEKKRTAVLTPSQMAAANLSDFDQNLKIHPLDNIEPSDSLRAAYLDRATRATLSAPNAPSDVFVQRVMIEENIFQLATQERQRFEIAAYVPAKEFQNDTWARTREEIMAEAPFLKTDAQLAGNWSSLAGEYRTKTGDETDELEWSKENSFRLRVARRLAQNVGLIVNGIESPLVRNVLVQASKQTETEAALATNQAYQARLHAEDARFFRAQLFTKNFINEYVQNTVRDEKFDHRSTEFPGYFQKFRKSTVALKSKFATGMARFFESVFRNEEDAYKPTAKGWFARNIPLVPDLLKNMERTVRTLPYAILLSYPVYYFVWQIHNPWSLYALGMALSFIHFGVVEVNNRLQRNMGRQPMRSAAEKLEFSFWHSLFTNPIAVGEEIVAEPVTSGFAKYVTQPIGRVCSSLLAEFAH